MLTYNMVQNNGKKTEFLYESIKKDILAGVLKAGEKLPSKRSLADHLGISVITVENAYAMLEEEGYVESRPRSGFYVCTISFPVGKMPLYSLSDVKHTGKANPGNEAGSVISMADETQADRNIPAAPDEDEVRSGISSPGELPKGMIKIMRRILNEKPEILLERPPHTGCRALRNAIADYLRRYRGMRVQPSNIIVGSGAEYLYGILVQLFGRDRVFGIEYPSYQKIEQVYVSNGASVEHLKMAADGIDSGALQASKADILHVSPYHSYPTGITASAAKRYEYILWAGAHDGYLIEDDFDSEFAYLRKPIEPIFSMEAAMNGGNKPNRPGGEGRVIYMNTFSKSIASSIRVAYLVLPDELRRRYEKVLGFYSCTVPVFDQYVLAEYIESGAFERHLNRIRRRINEIYGKN